MKKAFGFSILIIGALCLVFFLGLFIGRASVPSIPEVTHAPVIATKAATDSNLININTADTDQLQQLPGIGEVLAQRIIDYRNANGPFTSIQQLQEVEGIGSKIIINIMDKICLEDMQ